jgi:alginate O-acetyltransferase complex protein AlgI
MLFNSVHFILFFIVVTVCYFNVGWAWRWRLLLLSSCYFYMVFKPVYILILFATIVIDYYAGIFIEQALPTHKKKILAISLVSNIGILAFFKYYNFLNTNLTWGLELISVQNPVPFLDFILPIGLSFHTFQAMSYTFEVYRGNQKAERHFGIYALYVMFYPQLVAGPIERPQNVLPQFYKHYPFDWERAKSGLVLMAWGGFKKVVIADRLAMMVDFAYKNPQQNSSSTLLLATFFYTFQIYCDFSGYSDIALGAARVMGFELMENFKAPYFARSIAEFWRRWHISLSTWFRDYLYIELGGNRKGPTRQYINQFTVFMVSGLWHGAKWNFVVWGMLHGIFIIGESLRNKTFQYKLPPYFIVKCLQWGITFVLVMMAWVFFRANTLDDAIEVVSKIIFFDSSGAFISNLNTVELLFSFVLIGLLILKERFVFYFPAFKNLQFWLIFGGLMFLNYLLGVFNTNQFIYFQF